MGIAIALLSVSCVLAPLKGSAEQRGAQTAPDGMPRMVNEDVGPERWAVTRHPSGVLTGNVFRADGGDPAFIFCTPLGPPNAFACSGAGACVTPTCTDQYVFIANVTLPATFFELLQPCSEDYAFIATVTLPAQLFSPH